VIGNFYSSNASNNEPRQLQWLGPKTRLATLTIGGNDAHFGDVITTCFEHAVAGGAAGTGGSTGLGIVALALSSCRLQWNARVNAAIKAMGSNHHGNAQSLAQLYAVVANDSPNARILVAGYPRFFPASPPSTCATGAIGSFSKDTMVWIDQEILKMDQTIKVAVGSADIGLHSSRVQYVDTYNALSGHERCTATPWLNGIIRGRSNAIAGSFHPNSQGHRAIAKLVEEAYNIG
jgi:lysophospholipase L1-like esterase